MRLTALLCVSLLLAFGAMPTLALRMDCNMCRVACDLLVTIVTQTITWLAGESESAAARLSDA